MKTSQFFIIGLALSLCMIFLAGCKPKPTPKPVDAMQCEEARTPVRIPFLGDDVKGASQAVLDNIKPLYRIAFIFLGASGVVGLFIGLKAGLGLGLGGFVGLGTAVLLSEFPRTVLLFPAAGVVLLIAFGVVWIIKLWRRNQTLGVIVPAIDELDTGPQSPGRRIKKKIAESGKENVVRKGIEHIKKLVRGRK